MFESVMTEYCVKLDDLHKVNGKTKIPYTEEGSTPDTFDLNPQIEKALDKLSIEANDCENSVDFPLNDWTVEEAGPPENPVPETDYLWIVVYSKYDNKATWQKIENALMLPEGTLKKNYS